MKDSKVGPQQAKQRAEIAHLFEMCRGHDTMAVKSVLVKVRRIHCKAVSDLSRSYLGCSFVNGGID